MRATRTKRGIGILVLALVSILFSSLVASAHGYTTAVTARQKYCATGVVKNCGEIQYEPQSVEGPKGFPGGGPADGTLCSGGVSRFGQLNNQGMAWPVTTLTSGAQFTFSWTFTARHATTSFRYFVTKNGWNQGAALTRGALETTPFLNVPYNNQQPPATLSHSGTLPGGKTGRHMILAVWDIADTGNAFYSCSDVNFVKP
jgi:predicted carbohydrate-binding protein with CBM5 and CBM33 domain